MFQVNINDYVKVRLNDYGISYLKREREQLNEQIIKSGGRCHGPYIPRVDENGYTSFQIWDMMSLFGPHLRMGTLVPFDTNILFPNGKGTNVMLLEDLKKNLRDVTDELHSIAVKDDPQTNNRRAKLVGKREVLIDLLAKYDT